MMIRIFFCICSIICFSVPSLAQVEGWYPDNGDGTFTNPILWGDWLDPDIIRVNDNFYMVSTSNVPGNPILKSKDLVNWEMTGYALDRYDEDPCDCTHTLFVAVVTNRLWRLRRYVS